ncbi:hypothetical protein GINT2_001450 [Glugoides intestinalis]
MIIFVFLIGIYADVLLIDDLNLANGSNGRSTLGNITNTLQNKYGERVNVVTPNRTNGSMPYRMQNPNGGPQNAFNNRIGGLKNNMRSFPSNTKSFSFSKQIPYVKQRKVSNAPPIQQRSGKYPQNNMPRITIPRIRQVPQQYRPQGPVPNIIPSFVQPRPVNNNAAPPNNKIEAIETMFSPLYFPNLYNSTGNPVKPLEKAYNPQIQSRVPISTMPPHTTSTPTASTKPAETRSRRDAVELETQELTPEMSDLDKEFEDYVTDEPPKEHKRSISTETVTKTVKERKTISKTFTELKESTSFDSIQDEVNKTAEEVSKVVVPKLKRKKYLQKHNSDIISAGKARRTYLDYKILEAKENQESIEKKLKKLQDLHKRLSNRLQDLTNEKDVVNKEMDVTKKNTDETERAAKRFQIEITKNTLEMKKKDAEIIKLEKTLADEKDSYLILNDQVKILKRRFEDVKRKYGATDDFLKIKEKKLNEYNKLVDQLESRLSKLMENINEMEAKRRAEIEAQDKLEIEKKDIEDSGHLPLFALYE